LRPCSHEEATRQVRASEKMNPVASPEQVADALFARVATILDEARASVVRAVNSRMVLAYWHIGREIALALQGGEKRASFGSARIANLSQKLTARYGPGFLFPFLKISASFF